MSLGFVLVRCCSAQGTGRMLRRAPSAGARPTRWRAPRTPSVRPLLPSPWLEAPAPGTRARRNGFWRMTLSDSESLRFGLTRSDDRVLEAVEKLGGRVSVADVAARAGLDLNATERGLLALAGLVGAHLEVSRDGELVYNFASDVRQQLLRRSLTAALRQRWKQVQPFFAYLMRISFGIMLLVSIFIVFASLVVISSSSQGRDDERRPSYGRGPAWSGSNTYIWLGPNPFEVIFYPRPYDYSTRRRKEGMSFLESIFSFLFGDGDPNADLDERRWQRVAARIRECGGAVTAEQLAPFLQVPPPSSDDHSSTVVNESFMLPVLLRLDGRPEVTEDGDIVYVFPSLLTTAAVDAAGVAAPGTTESAEVLQERPLVFSKASSLQIAGAIALGAVNFLGAVTLGTYMSNIAAYQLGFLRWLYPPLLAYAAAFLAVPLGRLAWLRAENRQIEARNAARRRWLELLQRGSAVLRRKLDSARRKRRQLKRILESDVIYTSGKSAAEQNQDALEEFDKRLE